MIIRAAKGNHSQIVNHRFHISYGYDASGNQVCDSSGSQMAYDPYNQPTSIDKNGAMALFDYSSDGQRYRQTGTVGEVIYIDKMYERHNQTKHQYYVGEYAVVTDEGAGLEISYLHGDRLGSMIAISDASGNINVDEQRGFDPFGKPREGDWNDNDTSGNDLNGYDRTTRGFTGHEHLNGTEIIHMNGRTYDYNLGRFMSVDPIIQAPANSQSMNPYSYIMNNPLSGTDPSGYSAEFEDNANSGAGGDAGSPGAKLTQVDVEHQRGTTGCRTCKGQATKVTATSENGSTATQKISGGLLVGAVAIRSGASQSSPTTETGSNPQAVGGAGDAPSNNNDTVQNAMGQENGTQSDDTAESQLDRFSRILAGVRSEYFPDIPNEHEIDIEFSEEASGNKIIVGKNSDGTLNPGLLLVNPPFVEKSDGEIGLTLGHELIHIRDTLIETIDITSSRLFESEVSAYQWERENINNFDIPPEDRVRINLEIRNGITKNRTLLNALRAMEMRNEANR